MNVVLDISRSTEIADTDVAESGEVLLHGFDELDQIGQLGCAWCLTHGDALNGSSGFVNLGNERFQVCHERLCVLDGQTLSNHGSALRGDVLNLSQVCGRILDESIDVLLHLCILVFGFLLHSACITFPPHELMDETRPNTD